MRLWFKTLISNRFFQVSAGILVTMMIGGLVIQVLETGEITEGDTPFWWAIVTMTTVGYGDYSPSSPQGRLFAIIIMFIGISLVSLLTASISSIFVVQNIREGKGLEKLNLKNHIILCGWNPSAIRVLESIYDRIIQTKENEVVLVNDLDEKEIAQIKNKFPKMTVHFVAGDFTHEEILLKANLLMSNTVVILPNIAAGENEPHDEKTVFATLTIKNMDSSLRVIAYIYDRENLTHIKRANADEVVVVDDMSTHLLASHVIEPGVPQIANQLINSGSSYHFKRRQIPDEFVGKTYNTLFNHFRSTDGSILIGLYAEDENLGIGEILSTDTSALDEFIERKLKEGGVPLHDQSKIHVSVNPKKNYVLQDGEHAIIIP
tara:strand:- start:3033 stop:4160 length:1128 start_codon:yes stop_codon:yes gene_type:complete